MAGNKFATMVHRKTNKITLILVYAVLEWVLILLLLWNSLFSYLIIKFADYFGLKRPCLWCSRIDHILEPAKFKDSYRSLLCEAHALEVSRLGYCSSHRKLAESRDMCEDCSSPSRSGLAEKFAFFPWMKKLGILQGCGGDKVSENGEVDLKCSCCGVVLDTKLYSNHDYHLSKASWEDLHYTQEEGLVLASPDDEKVDEYDHSERNASCFMSDHGEDEQGIDENRGVGVGNRGEETGDDCLFSVSNSVSKDMDTFVDDGNTDVTKQMEEEQFKRDDSKESVEGESGEQAVMVQTDSGKDVSSEIQQRHLDFYIDQEDCHLIPVELTGAVAEKQIPDRFEKGKDEICGDEDFVLEFGEDFGAQYELIVEDTSNLEEEAPLLSLHDSEEKHNVAVIESREVNLYEGILGELDYMDLEKEEFEQIATALETQSPNGDGHDIEESSAVVTGHERESDCSQVLEEVLQGQSSEAEAVSEEALQVQGEEVEAEEVLQVQADEVEPVSQEGLQVQGDEVELLSQEVLQLHCDEVEPESEGVLIEGDELEAEVSIGPEIPDQDPIDDIQAEEVASLYQRIQEGASTSTAKDNAYEYDFNHAEEDVMEFKTLSIEISEPVTEYHLLFRSESNDIEEDKIPDTPTSGDSLHHFQKKLSLLERRESGAEESMDGSVLSDTEAGDGIMTVEKLKSALTAERKTLHALYAELEEERSASAVAANETMAMINRLQEEKAAMQMEALQYQRMMEEQAEYDQEALQLLNELMVKREKEKAELEKELEQYRRKLQDYEAKEKLMILRRRKEGSTRSGTCSASCSAAEDSDGLSVDLNHDGKEEDGFDNHQESGNQNTPVDAVLYLEESLAGFEEERISILEQLKILEEKLFTLSDGEEQHFEDIKAVEDLHEENGYHETPNHSSQVNGVANGHHKEMNGKHHKERKDIGAKAKRLLPLFDATDVEIEDEVLNGHEEVEDSVALMKSVNTFEIDGKKLAIEEEVDHVYERLQALEADREFLKHCITSLRKGDKGIELLQEILQHLRDLRSVELRVRNMGDGVL
ncbi:hypothetical protein Tsubulata_026681 [Turnera subulata]|uniref:GTD-binding domain-containing protein n=1 Tax=Turnera subulata TaxID=218843 RepID=A0A9Q0FRD2_9ROSI|nr:hypothetical protein Tsubulata_026681 [Turnera subulata]